VSASADAPVPAEWRLPDRGRVGIAGLIAAESALFAIFVVAYLYYLGRSSGGPTPREVLELPVLASALLWASSVTIHRAVGALRGARLAAFARWWSLTVLLGALFLASTAREWYRLIAEAGLTIRTNLFGTTYYSLVGLHASHVIVGLAMLGTVLAFTLAGRVRATHAGRVEVLSLYWHFVDAVWVVVFLVVYGVGR
jgi:cytochrome c oxidase subunit 3/cytochrome o ubiquinol oxidase subunit 3